MNNTTKEFNHSLPLVPTRIHQSGRSQFLGRSLRISVRQILHVVLSSTDSHSTRLVSSSLTGTLNDVTFSKIKQLFQRVYEVSLDDTDIDMQAKVLSLELSKEGLRLKGDLTIYGREVIAELLLSTEGLSLSAEAPKWTVDDDDVLAIENAKVTFFVGCIGKKARDSALVAKAFKKSIGWYGGFMVKGTFRFKKDLRIAVALQIVRTSGGEWGYIVTGHAESGLSLADLLQDPDWIPKGGNLDFSFKNVWLVASNVDVDATLLPPDVQKFPVKKGMPQILFEKLDDTDKSFRHLSLYVPGKCASNRWGEQIGEQSRS